MRPDRESTSSAMRARQYESKDSADSESSGVIRSCERSGVRERERNVTGGAATSGCGRSRVLLVAMWVSRAGLRGVSARAECAAISNCGQLVFVVARETNRQVRDVSQMKRFGHLRCNESRNGQCHESAEGYVPCRGISCRHKTRTTGLMREC